MKLGNPINHHIVMQIQILNEEEVEILKANINTRRYFYKFTKGQGLLLKKFLILLLMICGQNVVLFQSLFINRSIKNTIA